MEWGLHKEECHPQKKKKLNPHPRKNIVMTLFEGLGKICDELDFDQQLQQHDEFWKMSVHTAAFRCCLCGYKANEEQVQETQRVYRQRLVTVIVIVFSKEKAMQTTLE